MGERSCGPGRYVGRIKLGGVGRKRKGREGRRLKKSLPIYQGELRQEKENRWPLERRRKTSEGKEKGTYLRDSSGGRGR